VGSSLNEAGRKEGKRGNGGTASRCGPISGDSWKKGRGDTKRTRSTDLLLYYWERKKEKRASKQPHAASRRAPSSKKKERGRGREISGWAAIIVFFGGERKRGRGAFAAFSLRKVKKNSVLFFFS